MGVVTYLVFGDVNNAQEVGENFLSKKYSWVSLPGFDPSDFVSLYSILAKRRLSGALKTKVPLLYEGDAYVFEIGQELIMLLSQLSDRTIPDTAERWLGKGGWMMVELSVDEVEERLRFIRKIFKRSVRRKQTLLMFLSA